MPLTAGLHLGLRRCPFPSGGAGIHLLLLWLPKHGADEQRRPKYNGIHAGSNQQPHKSQVENAPVSHDTCKTMQNGFKAMLVSFDAKQI
jgi:hypothetical protein